MKYVGSKARIAKYIVPIIQQYLEAHGRSKYVEPFVGGANIITQIKHPVRLGTDNSLPLIKLLHHVTFGGGLPQAISKEHYDEVRKHPENYYDWYVGAVGYLASYNGKYFGGYAGTVHTKAGTVRDYYDEAKRNLEAQAKILQASPPVFMHADYRQLSDMFKDGLTDALIYADPPYEGTTGYKNKFNSAEFWDTCRKWANNGNTVLVSELQAPPDFSCIWEKPITRTLNHNDRSTTTEKLFIYKG